VEYPGGFSIGHNLKYPIEQEDPNAYEKWQSFAGEKKHSIRQWFVL
jgi:hypothetical protein